MTIYNQLNTLAKLTCWKCIVVTMILFTNWQFFKFFNHNMRAHGWNAHTHTHTHTHHAWMWSTHSIMFMHASCSTLPIEQEHAVFSNVCCFQQGSLTSAGFRLKFYKTKLELCPYKPCKTFLNFYDSNSKHVTFSSASPSILHYILHAHEKDCQTILIKYRKYWYNFHSGLMV